MASGRADGEANYFGVVLVGVLARLAIVGKGKGGGVQLDRDGAVY